MATVIQNQKELEEILISTEKSSHWLVLPIFSDPFLHPAVSNVCALAIHHKKSYIFSLNHPDAEAFNPKQLWTQPYPFIVSDLKNFNYYQLANKQMIDFQTMEFFLNGSVKSTSEFLTSEHTKMYEKFPKTKDLNKIIPLMKHAEYAESYFQYMNEIVKKVADYRSVDEKIDEIVNYYEKLNEDKDENIAIPSYGDELGFIKERSEKYSKVLHFIESAGLCVNTKIAKDKFPEKAFQSIQNDIIYSQYNPYNFAGRCSNTFGGLNFAALNKTDGIRRAFTSRWGNGIIVKLDFESFHLRLIAQLIKYDFPTDMPVHEFLGRQYFNKSTELTPEEYEESKERTFKLLYSEERPKNVPQFFSLVYEYVDKLWIDFSNDGYISTPLESRKIYSDWIDVPTKQKIFNYMIQSFESETVMELLTVAIKLFKGLESKIILWEYDELVLDVKMNEGKELFQKLIPILSRAEKYPIRIKWGANYQDLKAAKFS